MAHNLFAACHFDGKDGNTTFHHYDDLTCEGTTYTLAFSRQVTSSGINIVVTDIKNNTGGPVTDDARAFLTEDVEEMQAQPQNGYEFQTLGWNYLGNYATFKNNVDAAIAEAASKGFSFRSYLYIAGYTILGCEGLKAFYDTGLPPAEGVPPV